MERLAILEPTSIPAGDFTQNLQTSISIPELQEASNGLNRIELGLQQVRVMES